MLSINESGISIIGLIKYLYYFFFVVDFVIFYNVLYCYIVFIIIVVIFGKIYIFFIENIVNCSFWFYKNEIKIKIIEVLIIMILCYKNMEYEN